MFLSQTINTSFNGVQKSEFEWIRRKPNFNKLCLRTNITSLRKEIYHQPPPSCMGFREESVQCHRRLDAGF